MLYPIYFTLFVANLLGSAISLFLGAWILGIADFARSAKILEESLPEDITGFTEIATNYDRVGRLETTGTISSVFSFLMALVLLRNAFEIIVMMTNPQKLPGLLLKYRNVLEREYLICVQRQGYKIAKIGWWQRKSCVCVCIENQWYV